MKNYDKLMKNIEKLGERYSNKYLDTDIGSLKNNWWEALKFFFNHSFMRGRRDELSNEYCYLTISRLEDYFSITKGGLNGSYERLKENKKYFDKDQVLNYKNNRTNIFSKDSDAMKELVDKNPIIELLVSRRYDKTYNKEISLENDEDVMMVLDVLDLITDEGKENIFNYLRNVIVSSGVEAAYKQLDGIRAISDKIATFIIRDIALIDPEIKIDDYKMAFPVDTWVRRIANKLGCEGNDDKIKDCLVRKCREHHVDPLKFAAGIWFMGFHSLEILMDDCLGGVEIE